MPRRILYSGRDSPHRSSSFRKRSHAPRAPSPVFTRRRICWNRIPSGTISCRDRFSIPARVSAETVLFPFCVRGHVPQFVKAFAFCERRIFHLRLNREPHFPLCASCRAENRGKVRTPKPPYRAFDSRQMRGGGKKCRPNRDFRRNGVPPGLFFQDGGCRPNRGCRRNRVSLKRCPKRCFYRRNEVPPGRFLSRRKLFPFCKRSMSRMPQTPIPHFRPPSKRSLVVLHSRHEPDAHTSPFRVFDRRRTGVSPGRG